MNLLKQIKEKEDKKLRDEIEWCMRISNPNIKEEKCNRMCDNIYESTINGLHYKLTWWIQPIGWKITICIYLTVIIIMFCKSFI